MYFDVILATITNDGYTQSKCFLGATRLGQLATEYLDDRRQEYTTLEKIIRQDLQIRKEDIKELTEKVDSTGASLKLLLRKDSDVTTCEVKKEEMLVNLDLENDVQQAEKALCFLKEVTAVPSFEAIYPCLRTQVEQGQRLKKLWRKFERERDYLMNKNNHAELMSQMLKTTAKEEIAVYKQEKRELVKGIREIEQETEVLKKAIGRRRDLAARIRIALSQLLELSNNIKKSETVEKDSTQHFLQIPTRSPKTKETHITVQEEDGIKILPFLITKFTILMSAYFSKKRERKMYECLKDFETMMQPRIILKEIEISISDMSILGVYNETSHCLTREELKRQSQEIVEENTVTDDMMTTAPVKSSNKWQFKK